MAFTAPGKFLVGGYHSADGLTWAPSAVPDANADAALLHGGRAYDPARRRLVVLSPDYGLVRPYVSDDGGESFVARASVLVNNTAPVGANGETVVSGSLAGERLLFTAAATVLATPDGETLSIARPPLSSGLYDFALYGARDGVVLALSVHSDATNGSYVSRVHRSTDGGATWTDTVLYSGGLSIGRAFLVHYDTPRARWVARFTVGAFTSPDGITWTSVAASQVPSEGRLRPFVAPNGTVYLPGQRATTGSPTTGAVSTDGGISFAAWNPVTATGKVFAAQRITHSPELALYAAYGCEMDFGSAMGVYTSTDLSTWTIRQAGPSTNFRTAGASWLPFAGPPTTTALSPVAGAFIDTAAATTFTWDSVPTPGTTSAQTHYAYRRVPTAGGAAQWWSGTAWQATEVFIASAVKSVTLPAGAWPVGGSYAWAVATRNERGSGPYSTPRTVVERAAPTVAWTTPAAGATVTRSGPTLGWTGTAAPGQTLTGYQLRVLPTAQYQAADPLAGTAAYARTSLSAYAGSEDLPGDALASGGYTAVVRVRQSGDHWGPWAARAFTVTLPVVPTPTIALAVPTTGAPRVNVTVNWARGTTVGSVVLRIERSVDAGTTWALLAVTPASASGNAAGTFPDYTAPTGRAAQYRARADTTNGDENGRSAWTGAASATVTVTSDVLVDVATGTSVRARLASSERGARPWAGEVIYPLDGGPAVVVSGVPGLPEGKAVAAFRTEATAAACEDLLLGLAPLLWRQPPTDGGAVRADRTVRVKPGSVANRPASATQVRWAAALVEFEWVQQ